MESGGIYDSKTFTRILNIETIGEWINGSFRFGRSTLEFQLNRLLKVSCTITRLRQHYSRGNKASHVL